MFFPCGMATKLPSMSRAQTAAAGGTQGQDIEEDGVSSAINKLSGILELVADRGCKKVAENE